MMPLYISHKYLIICKHEFQINRKSISYFLSLYIGIQLPSYIKLYLSNLVYKQLTLMFSVKPQRREDYVDRFACTRALYISVKSCSLLTPLTFVNNEFYLFRVYNIHIDVYENHRQTFMLTKKFNKYCIYIIS